MHKMTSQNDSDKATRKSNSVYFHRGSSRNAYTRSASACLLMSPAAPLIAHATGLLELNQWVQSQLPKRYREHVQVLQYHNQQLTLGVTDACWITQLRHTVPDLISKLQKIPIFTELQNIRLRILPPSTVLNQTAIPERRLSAATMQCLKELADGVSHPRLKKALHKLAQFSQN